MKDKILYHQSTARTYIFLAKAMRSSWYFNQARKELKQAQILIDLYAQCKFEVKRLQLEDQWSTTNNLQLVA